MPPSLLTTLRSVLIVFALAMPWLGPWSWGPDGDMVQRLLSIACAAVFLAILAGRAPGLDTQALARCAASAWLLAAMLSSAAGLLQYFGLDASPWVSTSNVGLAYANLRQRNQFASLTTLGLLGLLYWVQARPQWFFNPTRAGFHAGGFALLLLALGNAASSSRTGLLQWFAAVALAWMWSRQHQRETFRWSVAALLAYLASMVLLPAALQWHSGADPASALVRLQEHAGCGSRMVLWGNVLELVFQRPWLGWGWGELKFAHFITPYTGARFCDILDNAHNLPLHLAVTLGVPLALLAIGLVLTITVRSRPWQHMAPAAQLAWAVLVAIGLHSLVEYPLWYGPFQMATALCLLILWGKRPNPMFTATLAGLAITAAAYGAWDYHRVGQLYLLPSERAAAYRENTFEKVRNSWLYQDEVRFAYVTTTPVTTESAAQMYSAALLALHYSPEPKVVAALLQSARLLGQDTPLIRRIRAQSPDESTP